MQVLNEFKPYTKKSVQYMRPYEEGELLLSISVAKEDTPEVGGMIAIDINNPVDKWYVSKKFFNENYVEAEETEGTE